MSILPTVLFVVMLATVVNGATRRPCPDGWFLPFDHSEKCYKPLRLPNQAVWRAEYRCLGEYQSLKSRLAYGLPDIHTQRAIIETLTNSRSTEYMVIYGRQSSWKNFGPNREDKSKCTWINMFTLFWETVECNHSQDMYALCEIFRQDN